MARNIQAVVLGELAKSYAGGTLPVLIEVYNEELVWGDNSYGQENMYLRVINDSQSVVYGGKRYIPCSFNMEMPEEDGKTIKPCTLTVSAIDSRMAQMLRSTALKSEVTIKACFSKIKKETQNGKTVEKFAFFPLAKYKFKVASANCTRVTATLTLQVEDVLSLQASRDKATADKFPALKTEG